MNTGNGGPTRQDSYFLSPFMLNTREMAYPAPTKGRSKLNPNAAMLFAPFGCTHPPPPAPPFLLAQSLSLKDIAGCDIMKLKVSRCRYATLGLKGLSTMGQNTCVKEHSKQGVIGFAWYLWLITCILRHNYYSVCFDKQRWHHTMGFHCLREPLF